MLRIRGDFHGKHHEVDSLADGHRGFVFFALMITIAWILVPIIEPLTKQEAFSGK